VSVVPAVGTISLARGVPSPDLLPLAELEECAAEAIRRDGRIALNYGAPGGYGPLREWLAERHGVRPSQVLATPGSMLGLNLLVAELVETGTPVGVDPTTYDRALRSLRAAGARLVGPGEPAGLRYVQPTFHNPTGATLSLDERDALVEAAIRERTVLIEDEPYGLLRFDGDRLPTVSELLRERGADELAVYSSSFSKSVAPGLRVGYVVLPEALAARVEARILATYVSPPILAQAQLFAFLDRGLLEPHLARVTRDLCERRDALVAALAEHLPGATWTVPDGGYFLWAELPEDAEILLARAREQGVAFEPGAGFAAFGGFERAARLAFSWESPDALREGVRRLGLL
jgi:DNA-binding transcriptional MocR family regulator